MAGPGVIDDYQAELAIRLPPPIVAELADAAAAAGATPAQAAPR